MSFFYDLFQFTDYSSQIFLNILVVKSDHENSFLINLSISLAIIFNGFVMISAIEFHSQKQFRTIEVENKRTYDLLSSEFVTK